MFGHIYIDRHNLPLGWDHDFTPGPNAFRLACTHPVSSKRSEASTEGIVLPPIGSVGTTIGKTGAVPLDAEAVVDDFRMTLLVRQSNAARNNVGSVLEARTNRPFSFPTHGYLQSQAI